MSLRPTASMGQDQKAPALKLRFRDLRDAAWKAGDDHKATLKACCCAVPGQLGCREPGGGDSSPVRLQGH